MLEESEITAGESLTVEYGIIHTGRIAETAWQ